jgi:hypothetical protein
MLRPPHPPPLPSQAVLVTLQLYGLVVVSDLSSDSINSYDAAENLNALVKPEVAILLVQALWLGANGRFLLTLCCGASARARAASSVLTSLQPPGALLSFKLRRIRHNEAEISVTDIVQKLSEKRSRLCAGLAVHTVLFLACISLLFMEALELVPDTRKQRVATGSVRPDHERER